MSYLVLALYFQCQKMRLILYLHTMHMLVTPLSSLILRYISSLTAPVPLAVHMRPRHVEFLVKFLALDYLSVRLMVFERISAVYNLKVTLQVGDLLPSILVLLELFGTCS